MNMCQGVNIKINRPALLHLCPQHSDRLLVVLVLVLGDGQLLLKLRRPVGDYLQVLLEESLLLGRFPEGLEKIISFLGYLGKREPELCDDRGQNMRVERLAFERMLVGGWGVWKRLGIQLMLEFEAQID